MGAPHVGRSTSRCGAPPDPRLRRHWTCESLSAPNHACFLSQASRNSRALAITVTGGASRSSSSAAPSAGLRAASARPRHPVTAAPPWTGSSRRITRAQERLTPVPGDWQTWAALGIAYLERSRITTDPTYYPKAEEAVDRSLAVQHRRQHARPWSRRARWPTPGTTSPPGAAGARPPSPSTATRRCVRRARRRRDPARPPRRRRRRRVQRLLDLRPGLSGYARASYDLEQRGQVGAGHRPDAAGARRRRRPLRHRVLPQPARRPRAQRRATWPPRTRVRRRARRRPDLGGPAAGPGSGGGGPRAAGRGARRVRRPSPAAAPTPSLPAGVRRTAAGRGSRADAKTQLRAGRRPRTSCSRPTAASTV